MVAVEAFNHTRGGSSRPAMTRFRSHGCPDARIVDLSAVFVVIAAVHAASGEVDADVGALKSLNPWSNLFAIPVHRLPGRCIGTAGEHGDVVAALLKITRQHLPHLSAAAGQHDAERAWAECPGFAHGLSVQRRGGSERRLLQWRWRITAEKASPAVGAVLVDDYENDHHKDQRRKRDDPGRLDDAVTTYAG